MLHGAGTPTHFLAVIMPKSVHTLSSYLKLIGIIWYTLYIPQNAHCTRCIVQYNCTMMRFAILCDHPIILKRSMVSFAFSYNDMWKTWLWLSIVSISISISISISLYIYIYGRQDLIWQRNTIACGTTLSLCCSGLVSSGTSCPGTSYMIFWMALKRKNI